MKIFQSDVELERKDFENSLTISNRLKNFSYIIKCICVYKALGSHHRTFHKTPKEAKLEHSKRKSSIKMVECFICLNRINELCGISKELGFTLSQYEDYFEMRSNEIDEKKRKRKNKKERQRKFHCK